LGLIEVFTTGCYRFCSHHFHFRKNLFLKIYLFFLKHVQILLVLLKSYFVSLLKFLVFKLLTRSPQISIIIKVSRNKGRCDNKNKTSNVKFSSMKKCRINIFLNNVCSVRKFFIFFFNMFLNFLYFFEHSNSISSIRLLSGLCNPHFSSLFLFFL
jgi:Tfp pilus assembly protein PilZ